MIARSHPHLTLLLGILLLTFAMPALAQVPGQLNYQGRLTALDGRPVADGAYAFTFSIFDAPSGGTQLWTESQSAVQVTNGIFSVLLGGVTPLTPEVFAAPNRYLEITVAGEIITPRTQLTSVAFAQRVGTIDGATSGTITGDLIIRPLNSFATDAFGAASFASIELSFVNGKGQLSLYEPVDSKIRPDGSVAVEKKLEIRGDGLVLFGATENDTNLVVAPNGDIIGAGQITMGQNSSPGIETSVLGFENIANGDSSAIGGGSRNVTNGTLAVIAGGHQNVANGEGSVIGGGAFNTTDGQYAVVAGGRNNRAAGDFSIVAGGADDTATGQYAYAAGRRAKAQHDGAFVWADDTDAEFASTGDDQFIVRASGGVGIGTNDPQGLLDVAGPAGDGSINLPISSIAAPELLDEPGLASARTAAAITLTQFSPAFSGLIATTITTPAPGFIVVRGGGNVETTGTSKRNQAYLQIAQTVGSTVVDASAALAGNGDHDGPSAIDYFSVSTERIFQLPAGTHTLWLEAQAHPLNATAAVTRVVNPYVTALFFPTSYGAVSTTAMPSNNSEIQ